MNKKVILELVGIDGNAFSVMGEWKRAARKQGWTEAECKTVLDEAMSGDYNHLLATIMENTESPDTDEDDDFDNNDLHACEFCEDEGCSDCDPDNH